MLSFNEIVIEVTLFDHCILLHCVYDTVPSIRVLSCIMQTLTIHLSQWYAHNCSHDYTGPVNILWKTHMQYKSPYVLSFSFEIKEGFIKESKVALKIKKNYN